MGLLCRTFSDWLFLVVIYFCISDAFFFPFLFSLNRNHVKTIYGYWRSRRAINCSCAVRIHLSPVAICTWSTPHLIHLRLKNPGRPLYHTIHSIIPRPSLLVSNMRKHLIFLFLCLIYAFSNNVPLETFRGPNSFCFFFQSHSRIFSVEIRIWTRKREAKTKLSSRNIWFTKYGKFCTFRNVPSSNLIAHKSPVFVRTSFWSLNVIWLHTKFKFAYNFECVTVHLDNYCIEVHYVGCTMQNGWKIKGHLHLHNYATAKLQHCCHARAQSNKQHKI